MKIALFLTVICVITKSTVSQVKTRTLQHNVTEGSRVNGDVRVYYQHFNNDGTLQDVTDEFWWPNSDGITRYFEITQIQILDYNPENAEITKISGGVGDSSVRYKLDSALNRGFDIEVSVWGLYKGCRE